MRALIPALALTLLTATAASFAQGDTTLHGTVTDAACGAHHGMKNLTAAQCTRECVKGGSDFALVSGDKVYTLKGDKAMMDKWAGQTVTVKGKVAGSTVMVADMSEK